MVNLLKLVVNFSKNCHFNLQRKNFFSDKVMKSINKKYLGINGVLLIIALHDTWIFYYYRYFRLRIRSIFSFFLVKPYINLINNV